MRILAFDTETSGLPDWHTPSEDPCQPHLVEITAVLFDDAGTAVTSMRQIIRPDGRYPKERFIWPDANDEQKAA